MDNHQLPPRLGIRVRTSEPDCPIRCTHHLHAEQAQLLLPVLADPGHLPASLDHLHHDVARISDGRLHRVEEGIARAEIELEFRLVERVGAREDGRDMGEASEGAQSSWDGLDGTGELDGGEAGLVRRVRRCS